MTEFLDLVNTYLAYNNSRDSVNSVKLYVKYVNRSKINFKFMFIIFCKTTATTALTTKTAKNMLFTSK